MYTGRLGSSSYEGHMKRWPSFNVYVYVYTSYSIYADGSCHIYIYSNSLSQLNKLYNQIVIADKILINCHISAKFQWSKSPSWLNWLACTAIGRTCILSGRMNWFSTHSLPGKLSSTCSYLCAYLSCRCPGLSCVTQT